MVSSLTLDGNMSLMLMITIHIKRCVNIYKRYDTQKGIVKAMIRLKAIEKDDEDTIIMQQFIVLKN